MILINQADELAGKINIIYNPLSELGLALDLLSHPEHHKLHKRWFTHVLSRFTHKEKMLLHRFGDKLDGFLNLDLHIDYLNAPMGIPLTPADCSGYIRHGGNWHSSLETGEQESLGAFLIFIWESYIFPVIKEHHKEIEEQIEYGQHFLREEGYLNFLKCPLCSTNTASSGRTACLP